MPRPCAKKGLDPDSTIASRKQTCEHILVHRQSGSERAVRTQFHRFLDRLQSETWPGRILRREPLCVSEDRRSRDNMPGEADRVRFLGLETSTGHENILRLADSHQPPQPLHTAGAGLDTQLNLG